MLTEKGWLKVPAVLHLTSIRTRSHWALLDKANADVLNGTHSVVVPALRVKNWEAPSCVSR